MRKEGLNRPHRLAGRQPVTPRKVLDSPAPATAIRRVLAVSTSPSPNDLRTLQRTIGNRAVQRLLAARAPRSSPAASQSIQRVKIPFYTESNEQLDTVEPLEIHNYATRMVAVRKDSVVRSIIQHLEDIREKPNVEGLISGLKGMLIMAKYNRQSMPDTRLTDTAKKLAEYQKEDYISVDGLMNVYKQYGEKIFDLEIEQLAILVAKKSERVFDTNTVSGYLKKEQSNTIMQKLFFKRVQEVSINEFDQLKEGLYEVGQEQWNTAQATKGGIYTEEMAPCITLGLTAYGPNEELYSALHHSFSPLAKATNMIQSLQQAFGKSGLPSFDNLKNVKYFAVGGDWSSIDKASDILTQLQKLGVDVSGLTLTTGLEEGDLTKAVIVTATGEIKYAAFKRSEFLKPSSQKETFGSGSLDFSSAKTVNEKGGFGGGFSSAKTVNELKDESTSPVEGFTSAKTQMEQQNQNDDDF